MIQKHPNPHMVDPSTMMQLRKDVLVDKRCMWLPGAKKSPRDTRSVLRGTPKKERNEQINHKFENRIRGLRSDFMKKISEIITLSDSDDDIILIPNPPTPIIELEDSDDDGAKKSLRKSKQGVPISAMQSSDDFVLNEDCHRLQKANDDAVDNILNLISDKPSELDDPLLDCNSCFVSDDKQSSPPQQHHPANKTVNVVVEDTGDFRAMDVYEESDSDENSCCSKALQQNSTTMNRQIVRVDDKDSETSITEVLNSVIRCRKSNNDLLLDILDENSTKIPYISKGTAVNCNNYEPARKRLSISGNPISDKKFISSLKSLAQWKKTNANDNNKKLPPNSLADDDSDDTDEEMYNGPTAREIAEKVIRHEELQQKTPQMELISKEVEKKKGFLSDLQPIFSNFGSMLKDTDEDIFYVPNDIQMPKTPPPPIISHVSAIAVSEEQEHKEEEAEKENTCISFVCDSLDNTGFGWSEEMYKFYTESWQGEGMSIKNLIGTLNPKNNWEVNTTDRLCSIVKCNMKLKCKNCSEFGHVRPTCKQPRKPLVCFMCGENDHEEPRCPNTLCLNVIIEFEKALRY